MNCEPIRGLLSAYLDDQLSAFERQSVAAHLDTCIECSAILSDYHRFDALLAQLPYLTPLSYSQKSRVSHYSDHYRLPNTEEYQRAVLTLMPLPLQDIDTPRQSTCPLSTEQPTWAIEPLPLPPVRQATRSKHLAKNATILLLLSTIGFLLLQYFHAKKPTDR